MTKQRILQAATEVAMTDGVINLTLEAVAREAGLSKGGLLYHFPNKQSLVAGMVADFTDRFETMISDRQEAQAPNQDSPESTHQEAGNFTRAFIQATFDTLPESKGLQAGLLAAVLVNPDLLDTFRQKAAEWQQKIVDDGVDPTRASLLRLAADGLWAAEILGLAPPDAELRERLRALMLDLVREADSDA